MGISLLLHSLICIFESFYLFLFLLHSQHGPLLTSLTPFFYLSGHLHAHHVFEPLLRFIVLFFILHPLLYFTPPNTQFPLLLVMLPPLLFAHFFVLFPWHILFNILRLRNPHFLLPLFFHLLFLRTLLRFLNVFHNFQQSWNETYVIVPHILFDLV